MTHHNSYTVLVHDAGGDYDVVEFSAPSVAIALCVARGCCPDRAAELFENGRRLGTFNRVDEVSLVQRAC